MRKELMTETRQRAADWHATQAIKAYRRRDYDTYVRHIKMADQLRGESK
jgi:hypothetical protein